MRLPEIVVMVSGSGTNLQALIDAVADGRIRAQITLVVSNREAAYGLVRAETAGIETLYFPLRPYRTAGHDREQYDADLGEKIAAYQPDLIVLAGWMHILSPAFLHQFLGKVINLHPALPGQFAGTDAIERAFRAFQDGAITYSGCMVHLAVPEVDAGTVIVLAKVPILAEDSLADFEARMHEMEHRTLVTAVQKMLRNGS